MTDRSEAMEAYYQSGPLAAVSALSLIADPTESAAAYRQALRDAYWKEKDMALVTTVAHAALGAILADAARVVDDQEVYTLRSEAKAICYDLASFTWPGWGEADLSITPDQVGSGLEAARENLRLAYQLEKADLPVSRAHWMLGVHLAGLGEYEDARVHLGEAAAAARASDAPDEAALADAFTALVGLLEGGDGSRAILEAKLAMLRKLDDGDTFVDQVTTAQRVFES